MYNIVIESAWGAHVAINLWRRTINKTDKLRAFVCCRLLSPPAEECKAIARWTMERSVLSRKPNSLVTTTFLICECYARKNLKLGMWNLFYYMEQISSWQSGIIRTPNVCKRLVLENLIGIHCLDNVSYHKILERSNRHNWKMKKRPSLAFVAFKYVW